MFLSHTVPAALDRKVELDEVRLLAPFQVERDLVASPARSTRYRLVMAL